ncbi:Lopap [Frankliniella fusca]|uniref:Lopap n=1 Tax=Frankliniella fusca TaxID=407009 RepID=A0AAE1H2I7_9NEOP|nr:Lopap [Frankliniella fusca]
MGRAPAPRVGLLLLLVSLAALAVRAQITEPGICPFSTPLADWDVEQFVAEPWYELKAFALPGLHDASPDCTRWHFTASPDGRGLHARLAYRAPREQGGDEAVVRAFAQYTVSERQPRFNMTFHDLQGGASRSVMMKLVASDYDDFALLWGCSEPNLFEREVVSWVLSRKPFLSEEAERALRALYRAHDIRAEKFVETDQADQTCGAPMAAVTPEDRMHTDDGQPGSVFAPYRADLIGNLDAAGLGDVLPQLQQEQPLQQQSSRSERSGSDTAAADSVDEAADVADEDDGGEAEASAPGSRSVSWSYVGATWPDGLLGTQGVLVAVLLVVAVVSLIASLLTFRALQRRLQRQRGLAKPVLPVHRQDVVVATLGGGVDYSRFGGGLGQGLVQTRKHYGADASASAAPRA